MTDKTVVVHNVKISQSEHGTISIRVYMPDNFIQTLMLTRGDYTDLADAVDAFNIITGRR